MRVLLTGSDGYLGAVIAPVLAGRGHEVVGLDAGFYRDGRLYETPGPTIRTVTKDIRRIAVDELRGYDAVVHLAELSNDPLGQHRPDVTYVINGEGSTQLAQRAKTAGVRRFVYSSSCSVYGAGAGEWKTEASTTETLTAYAACKLRMEAVLGSLADAAFSPTCLRNATAYGASPRMRFDIVLNEFAGQAWIAGQIGMSSDGSPWRPLAHVLDIAEAFACVLEAPIEAVHNEIFNVGCNEENYRIRDLAEIVTSVFQAHPPAFAAPRHDGRSYRVSFDRIARALPGFACRWNVRRGAEELRDLFERLPLTPEIFRFRAYTRLAQLEYLQASGRVDDRFFWRAETAAA